MNPHDRSKINKEVQNTLWGILVANLAITVVKVTVGLITGALAVVADGFHSLVDTSSNLIGITAVRLSSRPADDRHPYGYRRYETIGTLAIGGLLIVAAWEIIQNVVERLIQGDQPDITILHLVLIALTFPVNLAVVIFETRTGKRLGSEILMADAAHTRSDLYVTGSVILSMVGVWLGVWWLDFVLAVIVVGFIIKASIGILRFSVASLTDAVMVDPGVVEKAAMSIPGVRYVHNIRSRGTSDAVFVDLHVKVNPMMSTTQAHEIATQVEERVCSGSSKIVDAVVHIEPALIEAESDWEHISLGLRSVADEMGLGLHNLHIHVEPNGSYSLDMDLELKGDITLAAAHKFADEFEKRSRAFFPQAEHITTHLEPVHMEILHPNFVDQTTRLEDIQTFIESTFGSVRVLDIQTRVIDGRISLTLKMGMPADISLVDSHITAEEIKSSVFRQFSDLYRIIIHVEPINEVEI
jgi:cation diffusion facilitator family transporter